MSDVRSADIPVAIDRVDCTRTGADGVELRLTGRWTNGGHVTGTEPLLVVQVQGRRHRFAPDRDGYTPPPGSWAATFQLPSWAQPRQEGQAALWVGTSVVPIPLPGSASDGRHHLASAPLPAPALMPEDVHRPPPPPALGEARAWPADVAPPPAEADPARLADAADLVVDTGRTGPLAELLFKESVSALHAELEQRSAEVARLQGLLADAQSELEARSSRQSALESAHGDLRGELQELMSAVGAQREDFEGRLSEAEERAREAEAERDRVRAELEAELARVRTEQEAELARVRAEAGRSLEAERASAAAQLADLDAARDAAAHDAADLRHRLAAAASGRQHHAAELSALRDQLAAAQVSREAAASEVAGLRVELERLGSELAVTREHQSAQGADLGEAQRLLAEARSLSEQLRSQSSQ
jgi:predicted  nucleic acid-binding Zn-ribbon protein